MNLGCDGCDWQGHDGSWGYNHLGDERYFLTRFYSAAHMLTEVQTKRLRYEHPFPFGFWVKKIYDDEFEGSNNDWPNEIGPWDYVVNGSKDGLRPDCRTGEYGLNPHNVTNYGLWESVEHAPIQLGYPFAFDHADAVGLTVAERAGTLVHEAAHSEIFGFRSSHLEDNTCDAGGSCDTSFGRMGANTFEIVFLLDVFSMYPIDALGNPKVSIDGIQISPVN